MEEMNVVVEPAQNQMTKKKGVAILLCLFGGILGLHKFYEGKIVMGILYILTVGFMGIGVLIDLIRLIGKPSEYVVEKKNFKFDPNAIIEGIKNIPVDRIGTIISCIGGGLIGMGCAFEWNGKLMLIGLVIGVAGAVISFLKRRNIMDTLRVNGITIGISAVAVAAFLLAVAAVIIWVVLKLVLGIDIFAWLMDVFGGEERKKEPGNGDGIFSTLGMPDKITGPYGETYSRLSAGVDSSDYVSESGKIVTIHNSEIDASLAGKYAETPDGTFTW